MKKGRTWPQSSSSYHFSGASCWFSEIFWMRSLGRENNHWATNTAQILHCLKLPDHFSPPLLEAGIHISRNVLGFPVSLLHRLVNKVRLVVPTLFPQLHVLFSQQLPVYFPRASQRHHLDPRLALCFAAMFPKRIPQMVGFPQSAHRMFLRPTACFCARPHVSAPDRPLNSILRHCSSRGPLKCLFKFKCSNFQWSYAHFIIIIIIIFLLLVILLLWLLFLRHV